MFDIDEAKKYINEVMEQEYQINDTSEISKLIKFMESAINEIERLNARIGQFKEHNYIDATPDGKYALRILSSYLDMTNCILTDNTTGDPSSNPFINEMNKLNELRRKELTDSIKKLTS